MLSAKSVSFVMTADDLITVELTDPMSLVRRLLSEKPIHHIPVLDAGKLVGCQRHVERACAHDRDDQDGGDDCDDQVLHRLTLRDADGVQLRGGVGVHLRPAVHHRCGGAAGMGRGPG